MKMKFNWKQFALFFIVVVGLYYLTRSFFMTAGIMVLLLLVDGLLLDYDNRRRGRKQSEEIMERLNQEDEGEDARK